MNPRPCPRLFRPRPVLLLAACAVSVAAAEIRIRPSLTDPAIEAFDSPHIVYPNQAGAADRHQLLLWIPGTQPPGAESKGPGVAGRFCEMAAALGYRAIVLRYPNDEPAKVCDRERDPAAFEKFRMAIIAGGKSEHLTVRRADSIENRLIKLLAYLQQHRPAEDWGQFLTADGGIRWEAIAVAGHSQGGGHAALLGIKHRVARVLCLASPKDYSSALGKPAAWLSEESATPKELFFSFFHDQDHQGCSPAEQLENVHALKLAKFGPPANIDLESAPFHHARILTTNYPGKKLESKVAHTSVISPKNEAVFGKVWTYMLTENPPRG